jgi:hypothetical protein
MIIFPPSIVENVFYMPESQAAGFQSPGRRRLREIAVRIVLSVPEIFPSLIPMFPSDCGRRMPPRKFFAIFTRLKRRFFAFIV